MDLKIVVENHPECLTNRSRLAAVLRDLYPNERLLVNIAQQSMPFQCKLHSKALKCGPMLMAFRWKANL